MSIKKESQRIETVQLVPEALFFVLQTKFGYGDKYRAEIPAMPDAFKMQPVKIYGRELCIGLHKDRYVSKLFLFNGLLPYRRPGDKKNHTVLIMYGGKVEGPTDNKVYKNKLYVDFVKQITGIFDPSQAISVIFGELALLNGMNPLPKDLIVSVDDIETLPVIRMISEKAAH